MPGLIPDDFRFLYRTDLGRIDRARWISGALPLVIVFGVTSAVLHEVIGYANRDLSQRAFYDLTTFVTNAYILAYAMLTILIGISWVNLGAKRFRDRGRPAPLGLAGLTPLAGLVAGAAHWLQPRVTEVMPYWSVTICDALLIVAAAWTLAEMFDAIPKARAS